jgi:hypothetical protein
MSHQKHYFVKYHSDSTHKYSAVEIEKMLKFLIDNIYVVVGVQVFQQSVGIPMGTYCAPLLADLFLYSKVNLVNSSQNEGLSPSGIALSFDGFGSIS